MQHQWHAGGGGGRTKSESGKAGRVSSGGGVPREGGRGNYGTQLLVARESLDRDSQQPDNSCTPQLFGCGALPTCHLPCNVNIARKINTSVYLCISSKIQKSSASRSVESHLGCRLSDLHVGQGVLSSNRRRRSQRASRPRQLVAECDHAHRMLKRNEHLFRVEWPVDLGLSAHLPSSSSMKVFKVLDVDLSLPPR